MLEQRSGSLLSRRCHPSAAPIAGTSVGSHRGVAGPSAWIGSSAPRGAHCETCARGCRQPRVPGHRHAVAARQQERPCACDRERHRSPPAAPPGPDLQLPRPRPDRLELRPMPGGAVTGSRQIARRQRPRPARHQLPRAELPSAQTGRRRARLRPQARGTRAIPWRCLAPHSRHSSTIVTFGGGVLLTDGLLARRTRNTGPTADQARSAQRAGFLLLLPNWKQGHSKRSAARSRRRLPVSRQGVRAPAPASWHRRLPRPRRLRQQPADRDLEERRAAHSRCLEPRRGRARLIDSRPCRRVPAGAGSPRRCR
jgi:hypothetical protein